VLAENTHPIDGRNRCSCCVGAGRALQFFYLDQNNELQYCWTTSWGASTRMVGAVIMVHGDDQGLILPPKIAPIQVVIVPIWRDEEGKEKVLKDEPITAALFTNWGGTAHLWCISG